MFQRSVLLFIALILPFAVYALPSHECLYQLENLQGSMEMMEAALLSEDLTYISVSLGTMNVVAINFNTVCEQPAFVLDAQSDFDNAKTCSNVVDKLNVVLQEYFDDSNLEESSQKFIDLNAEFQSICITGSD